MSIVIITGFVLVVFYASFRIVKWIYSTHQTHLIFKKLGIPGPEPEFFSGNLRSLISSKGYTEVISEWIAKYGKVFGVFVGNLPVIVTSDPDIIKELFVKQWHNFINRVENVVNIYPLEYGLLQLKDQRWKELRRILTPMFNDRNISIISHSINEKVNIVLEIIGEKVKFCEPFDIGETAKAYAMETTSECLLGIKVGCLRNPHNMLYNNVKDILLMLDMRLFNLIFSFSNPLHILKAVKKYSTMRSLVSSVVKEIRKQLKSREANPHRQLDVLQLLIDTRTDLSAHEEGKSPNPATDDEIIGNIFTLIAAGFDTTSATLSFAFYLLSHHQKDQQKLYSEIHKLWDSTQIYESIQNMEYLEKVWSETLRLFPPVIKGISRICNNTCAVGQYIIPEGTMVQAAIYDMHHDPQLWEDPWEFKPERFCKADESCTRRAYIPSGVGPRSCIAIRFANFVSKLLIARLVKEFKFVPSSKTAYPIPLNDSTASLRPEGAVFLKAIPRD